MSAKTRALIWIGCGAVWTTIGLVLDYDPAWMTGLLATVYGLAAHMMSDIE